MMAYELENTGILKIKDIDYRCVTWNMAKNGAINRIIMNMNFGTNKTPIEIVKEGAFGGTYFRDIYSGINGK